MREDGFHLLITRVTNTRAWDYRTSKAYNTEHFCSVFIGRTEAEADDRLKVFAEKFEQGNAPGMYQLSVTKWQSYGEQVNNALCWHDAKSV